MINCSHFAYYDGTQLHALANLYKYIRIAQALATRATLAVYTQQQSIRKYI